MYNVFSIRFHQKHKINVLLNSFISPKKDFRQSSVKDAINSSILRKIDCYPPVFRFVIACALQQKQNEINLREQRQIKLFSVFYINSWRGSCIFSVKSYLTIRNFDISIFLVFIQLLRKQTIYQNEIRNKYITQVVKKYE